MGEVLTFEVCFCDSDRRVKLFVTRKDPEEPISAGRLLKSLAVKMQGELLADDVYQGYFWAMDKEYAGEQDVSHFAVLTFLYGKTRKQKGLELIRSSGNIPRSGGRRPPSPRTDTDSTHVSDSATDKDAAPKSPRKKKVDDPELRERLEQRRFQSVLRVKKERASAKRAGLESVLRDAQEK